MLFLQDILYTYIFAKYKIQEIILTVNFPQWVSARNFAAVLLGQKCKPTYVHGYGEAQKPDSRVSIQKW
jgi:hypothetical protein